MLIRQMPKDSRHTLLKNFLKDRYEIVEYVDQDSTPYLNQNIPPQIALKMLILSSTKPFLYKIVQVIQD